MQILVSIKIYSNNNKRPTDTIHEPTDTIHEPTDTIHEPTVFIVICNILVFNIICCINILIIIINIARECNSDIIIPKFSIDMFLSTVLLVN